MRQPSPEVPERRAAGAAATILLAASMLTAAAANAQSGSSEDDACDWSSSTLREMRSIEAEWIHTGSTTDRHVRQLRFRLWLGAGEEWTLMCDELQPDPTARVDQGVRGDTWWSLDGATLRYRPVESLEDGLRDGDRNPALAAALLQLGHFVHGGHHLAAVLGDAVLPEADARGERSFETSFGCRIRLESGLRRSLTILAHPSLPAQDGVVYRYGETRAFAGWDGRVHPVVEHFVPGRDDAENRLELVALTRLDPSEAIPHPDLDGDYPRPLTDIDSVVDTRGPLRRELQRGPDGVLTPVSTPKTALHYGSLALLTTTSLLLWWLSSRRRTHGVSR